MGLTLITAPTVEPVSLAEAKTQLRVTSGAENDYITGLITVARQRAETFTNRALITQTWDWTLDQFGDVLEVPLPTLQSITSIKYQDTDNTEQTWSSDEYSIDILSEPGRIKPAIGYSYPSIRGDVFNPITIRFIAGYGDAASDVNENIVMAIKLMVAEMFEYRTPLQDIKPYKLPTGAEALMWPHRFKKF